MKAILLSTLLPLALVTAPASSLCAQQPVVRPAPPSLLAKFDVSAGTVQVLQPQAGSFGVAVPIVMGGAARTMHLHLHEMRAPNFQLLVEDAAGIHQVPTPPCTTYRGHLLEEPDTKVAASIVDGAVSAIVYRPGMMGAPPQNWVVQPVREVDGTARPSVHVVFLATDTVPLPFHCGTTTGSPTPVLSPVGLDTTYVCDIAIEADVEFYQLNGSSVAATQSDVTNVMNQVEFIYDRDCDLQYTITTILVTTTSVYTSNDADTLLSQFASRWNSVHAGVLRDVAHLFTGRDLIGTTIGLAQLSSICNLGVAYGLSQSRFSANFNSRVGLTSHELGHGWSAQHCDAANPCFIMCATLGACNGNVTLFGPTEISQITTFAATRPCLSIVPLTPVIAAATPTSVTVFNPGTVNLTGSGFTGATAYRVGFQAFNTGFVVNSDSSMNITMPQGAAPGSTTLGVTNVNGNSNSFPFTYTVTAPPKLKTTGSVPAAGGIANFDFAGTPGRLWFLVLGLTNTTSPLQGFPLLTPHLLLTSGTFSAPSGITNLPVPVPPGLGLLILYLQVLEADPALPIATGVTNITVTVLL